MPSLRFWIFTGHIVICCSTALFLDWGHKESSHGLPRTSLWPGIHYINPGWSLICLPGCWDYRSYHQANHVLKPISASWLIHLYLSVLRLGKSTREENTGCFCPLHFPNPIPSLPPSLPLPFRVPCSQHTNLDPFFHFSPSEIPHMRFSTVCVFLDIFIIHFSFIMKVKSPQRQSFIPSLDFYTHNIINILQQDHHERNYKSTSWVTEEDSLVAMKCLSKKALERSCYGIGASIREVEEGPKEVRVCFRCSALWSKIVDYSMLFRFTMHAFRVGLRLALWDCLCLIGEQHCSPI